MLSTTQLNILIQGYFQKCSEANIKPTQSSFASWLSVAPQTISNYKYGLFNGMRYTKNPSPTRIIDNADMPIITEAIERINERNDSE